MHGLFKRLTILLLAVFLLASCAPAQVTSSTSSSSETNTTRAATAAASPASNLPTSPTNPSQASNSSTNPTGSSGAAGQFIQFDVVPEKSQASYKVREQLARLNLPSDAVGMTKSISGSVFIQPDGVIDATRSKFVVDLNSLKTDEAMRDNYVRRSILQTDQYPQAVFVPKQVSGLSFPLPQSGNVTFQVSGDLTIRDVTKPVTWNVTGSLQNGEASGTATTSFTFEDFNLTQPRVPVVLSVVDLITLEVTVDLKQVTP